MVPLTLAGGMSIAANVATAHNVIQVIYGVWTVAAYIVAELFVAKMERKAPAPAEAVEPAKAAVRVSDRERNARKRAGYDKLDKAGKRAWTKAYRARVGAVSSVSPAAGPHSPSVEVLEEITR